MSEQSPSPEDYLNRLQELRLLCHALVADCPDSGGFKYATFRYADTGVGITADDEPTLTHNDCSIELYQNPTRDEHGEWVLPITVYELDGTELKRFFRREDDRSIIEPILSPRLKELIDFPEVERRLPPRELLEILDRDPGSIFERIDPKDMVRVILEPTNSRKWAKDLGVDCVSDAELDELMQILREVQKDPQKVWE